MHSTESITIPATPNMTSDEAIELAVIQLSHPDWVDNSSIGEIDVLPKMTERQANLANGSDEYEVFSWQSYLIPIVADSDSVTTTKTHTVPLTKKQLDSLRGMVSRGRTNDYTLTNYVKSLFGLDVVDWSVASLPTARKAVATATEGKAVTTYQVVSFTPWEGSPQLQIVAEKESQAEARATALELMNADATYHRLAVRAKVNRESGEEDLVTITRPVPEESNVKLNITMTTVKPEATVVSYRFLFDYHS